MKILSQTRNIGISAHIDSGKTTLTERILFYCDKIHKIEEVKGRGSGAQMDYMELEREKGITITSASTTVFWHGIDGKGIKYCEEGEGKKVKINVIDTPGHVDFTVEVERSLRVLDGAILVLCSVAGVQSQSITVDRQMKRYQVPRLAFLNKMDRAGADPLRGVETLKEKLHHNAALMQIPIGKENNFEGIIDLIAMKALYFEGANGEKVKTSDIPEELKNDALNAREHLLDVVSEFSDSLTEKIIEEENITEEEIHHAIKIGVNSLKFTPVFIGSAFKNKGVQPLLDAIARYLPGPLAAKRQKAHNILDNSPIELVPDTKKSLVCMAFKLTDETYGQLTYIRIYQGEIEKGMNIYNTRTKKKVRVGRLVRMHANDRENIERAGAGDIIAMVGVECASGDTFVGNIQDINISLESMHVPIPVIEYSISAKDNDDLTRMNKGLNRFRKEDPTFHIYTDEESKETRIAGMGELHLEIYIERLQREYNVDVIVGPPQVNYRETIKGQSSFNYTHKKQTGGAGQFGQVVGEIRGLPSDNKEREDQIFKFRNKIKGGAIPSEYISACEQGFKDVMQKGPLAGFPLIDVEVDLIDGKHHAVDSSDLAFRTACQMAMKNALKKASPTLLEPLMSVIVETPEEFQGSIIGDLSSRRGIIQGTEISSSGEIIVNSSVPLSEMFGYATHLRSLSAGKATYTMEFLVYKECPLQLTEKVIKERAKKK